MNPTPNKSSTVSGAQKNKKIGSRSIAQLQLQSSVGADTPKQVITSSFHAVPSVQSVIAPINLETVPISHDSISIRNSNPTPTPTTATTAIAPAPATVGRCPAPTQSQSHSLSLTATAADVLIHTYTTNRNSTTDNTKQQQRLTDRIGRSDEQTDEQFTVRSGSGDSASPVHVMVPTNSAASDSDIAIRHRQLIAMQAIEFRDASEMRFRIPNTDASG